VSDRLCALVLDGGSGQSLAIARRLGAAGWKIVTEAGSRTARSRFTAATVAIPTTDDASAYVDALTSICSRHAVDLVIPTNDNTLELSWAAAPRLGDTRILGGDQRSVETFLDKAAGIAAAERHGFPVPRTLVPETLAEVPHAAAELGFPCVVKPRRSFLSSATERTRHLRHLVVSTAAEAEAAARSLGLDGADPPLVQALADGRSLAATFVLQEGRTLARAVRETLSFWPVSGGTSVWKKALPLDTPGVAEAERFLLDFGLEGLAEIEYQLDESGIPRLMEVGPRAHGWIPLAEASCSGLIEVAAAVAVGRPGRELSDYRPGVEMRWLRGEIARVRLATTPSAELPSTLTRAGILRTAWPPWKPGMRYDIIDLDDPGPWAPRLVARLLQAG
jgi:predicted ATP-grasp superfamily ATP-dependent carboligase